MLKGSREHNVEETKMTRYFVLVSIAVLVVTCALQAQTANPLSTEAKQAYNAIKGNLQKMAEKMPEENYSFKPTPDIRSFGETIAHTADSQMRMCSGVNGQMKSGNAASKTTKADLVAALADSFAECDKAFEALTDATATEIVAGRGQRTKLGTLVMVTTHGNEEYGYLAVYLRLKGIVPPSSDRSGRGAMPAKPMP
jgi:PBP1b-binding outer membrane lipoprotein LpoB